MTSIGNGAFGSSDLITVVSLIEEPFSVNNPFNQNTLLNGTLYVPIGAINKYKATESWNKFVYIEEGTGPNGGGTPTTQKCDKPTISYQKGKLMFNCTTEGAVCQYTITDNDIQSDSGNELQLGVTPKTEGITNGVANVRANPVLIQSNGNVLSISGAPEGAEINVYTLSGQKAGSAKAAFESTNVITIFKAGEVGIVKIGEKSVKVVLK